MDDVDRLYTIVDHNLDENIAIDFHSHNNYQLSFAFAQEIIRLSNGKREVIIDGTLNGMGKCAGNLNTELLVDYLVRKRNYDYDFDAILDIMGLIILHRHDDQAVERHKREIEDVLKRIADDAINGRIK